jgi:hypothetical protein
MRNLYWILKEGNKIVRGQVLNIDEIAAVHIGRLLSNNPNVYVWSAEPINSTKNIPGLTPGSIPPSKEELEEMESAGFADVRLVDFFGIPRHD